MKVRLYLSLIAITIFSLSGFCQTDKLPRKNVDGKEFYIYTVDKSEGFYALFRKFGTSQSDIIKYNPEAKNGLKQGQTILIPIDDSTENTSRNEVLTNQQEKNNQERVFEVNSGNKFFNHTVKRGETLYAIALMYQIPIKDITDANPGTEQGIREGAILKIPQSYQTGKVPEPVSSQDKPKADTNEQFIFHTIESGETLYSVSKKYNTEIESILLNNPGISPSHFNIGTVLRIIPGIKKAVEKATKTEYTAYKVQKNETLYSIARHFNISVDDIIACNPGLKSIKKDQIINIPKTVQYIVPEKALTNDEIDRIYNRLYKCDKKEAVNVAVILPFMLNNKPDSKSNLYIDYYQGLLMAVDSLKRKGTSVNLYVYDSEGSDATVRSILNKKEMSAIDMIIAPEQDSQIEIIADYALKHNINVVNSFSLKSNEVTHNAKIFQTNIPHSYLYAEASNRFIKKFRNKEIVFLNSKEEGSSSKEFSKILKDDLNKEKITYKELNFDSELKVNALDDMLNQCSNVIFVPTSGSRTMLSKIMAPLVTFSNDHSDMDISLFGYPEWITYTNEQLNNYHKLNTFIFSRFYANVTDNDYKDFNSKYHYWYNQNMVNAYPLYAVLGFDTGLYFLEALRKYGHNFGNKTHNMHSKALQTDFQFERINNWSGFINKSFYFVNFTPAYNIVKIKN